MTPKYMLHAFVNGFLWGSWAGYRRKRALATFENQKKKLFATGANFSLDLCTRDREEIARFQYQHNPENGFTFVYSSYSIPLS